MIIKTLTIILLLNLSLLATNTKEKIDLTNKNNDIKIIDEDINFIEKKTKEDYEKKSDLLNPEYKEIEKTSSKKEDDIKIDGGVDFDKSEKTINGLQLNLGTKF